MSPGSTAGQGDLMRVGAYLVTFDEAGADIEQKVMHARYRVQATTASNAADFMKYHKRLIFAMMGNDPGELEAFRVQSQTEEGQHE
jgi:hypothetical protein